MYLKESTRRLRAEVDRAHRRGYIFAGKLVRGAYMTYERAEAKRNGVEDPILDSIQETHRSYDEAVEFILSKIRAGQNDHVMLATHNLSSVQKAVRALPRSSIQNVETVQNSRAPSIRCFLCILSQVYFAQLYGMKDHITFALGAKGFQAFKYLNILLSI